MFSLPRLNVYLNVRFAKYNIFANKDPNTNLDSHREAEKSKAALLQKCLDNIFVQVSSCAGLSDGQRRQAIFCPD